MARGRSQLKGALALRRTLRALPDAVTTEVADELRDIGVRQLARARAEVPLSLIHISEPTRPCGTSRMPSSA